jgi:hypothetical protein
MLADMGDWGAVNRVYVTSGLALGARVEIECLATT